MLRSSFIRQVDDRYSTTDWEWSRARLCSHEIMVKV